MGGMCAKNNAGRVTTDMPPKRSTQTKMESGAPKPGEPEQKYFSSGKHFNTVSEDPDTYARETAEEYCRTNPGWRYTGKWKNMKEKEGAEISWYQLEKIGRNDTMQTD